MLSDITRQILEELLRPLFFHLTHFLGRLLIGLVTIGTAHCDPWNRDTTWRSHRRTYGWLGIYRRHGRGIAFSGGFTALIGCLPYIGLFIWLYFSHGPSSQPILPTSPP